MTIPATVDCGAMAQRVFGKLREVWEIPADEESAEEHVRRAVADGQCSADYDSRTLWLFSTADGIKAAIGRTPDRLRREMMFRWDDTQPEENEQVVFTTAPKDYDWAWTRTLLDDVGEDRRGRKVRKVAIQKAKAPMQLDRYFSGLHLAVDQEEWDKLVKYDLVKSVQRLVEVPK